MTFILPKDATERKKWPVGTFLREYFPNAICYLAHLSWVANEQHNPGEPMHWARNKSTDQVDTMMRHFMEGDDLDSDEMLHTGKAAWRALARLEEVLEEKHVATEPAPITRSWCGACSSYADECACGNELPREHDIWTCDCEGCERQRKLSYERRFPRGIYF